MDVAEVVVQKRAPRALRQAPRTQAALQQPAHLCDQRAPSPALRRVLLVVVAADEDLVRPRARHRRRWEAQRAQSRKISQPAYVEGGAAVNDAHSEPFVRRTGTVELATAPLRVQRHAASVQWSRTLCGPARLPGAAPRPRVAKGHCARLVAARLRRISVQFAREIHIAAHGRVGERRNSGDGGFTGQEQLVHSCRC